MESMTTTHDTQVEAIMGLLGLFGHEVTKSVQSKLNDLYELPSSNGSGNLDLAEFADRLEEIIENVGCGELPEPSIDIDSIAQEAADAAYEAARDAVNNASYDADSSGELDDAQSKITDALDAARGLLSDVRNP